MKSSLVGKAVAFCFEMSQLIVDIVEQSFPEGQQMTDLSLLKGKQFVPTGQQKLEGSPGLLHTA